MKKEIKVSVEASGKHVHLCQKDMDVLFGEGHVLEKKKSLGGGDFLSTSKVEVLGADGKSCMCSVLGPCRKISQVEISFTEARAIGLCPPVGDSGINDNWDPITIRGPKGEVHLEKGIFVARRHVHMCWDHAQELGVQEGDSIDLRMEGPRAVTFHELKARIAPKDVPVHESGVHLDYDEFNAAEGFKLNYGYISKGEN